MTFRFALACIPAFAACAIFDPGGDCTLIGGESGLTVRVRNVTSPITRIDVSPVAPGGQPAYVADCARLVSGCDHGVFFPEYSAPSAGITVVSAAGTVSGTTRLEYRVSYPNGPNCAPRVVSATATIDARNGSVVNGR